MSPLSRAFRASAVSTVLAASLLSSVVLTAAPSWAVTKLTDSQAASQLAASGIGRSSSGGCTNRNVSTCTSYEQINQDTVTGIKTFRSISGCAITITGGTETGHASGTYSHWNGYKVDVPLTTCISNYITSHYAYAGTRADGARLYKSPSGNVYARESSHWDITYYTCGC
ncbi:MAG: hypothetical protein JWN68_1292 [Nocardioides sp.]|jgi:hypothetical protein|uniref:hypothetical protein n=1 Tax=Nocardioides sp. TaxID=35761 RepID=UPI002611BB18|nr:hypothetical protein [Nocardioides sp.]MCW2833339.1 hypothetical protein [Nocardioides sp.]